MDRVLRSPAACASLNYRAKDGSATLANCQWLIAGITQDKGMGDGLFGIVRAEIINGLIADQSRTVRCGNLSRSQATGACQYKPHPESEAPRGKPRGIFAEPCEAKDTIQPCGKPQGFLAKKGRIKQLHTGKKNRQD